MPDFTLNEITELLRQAQSSHPSLNLNVEEFQSSVEKSLKDLITTREENKINKKPAFPQEYFNKELEFFIVYHLSSGRIGTLIAALKLKQKAKSITIDT